MPSEQVFQLATAHKTVNGAVTEALATDPKARILDIAYKVFPEKPETSSRSKKLRIHDDFTKEELDAVEKCGQFPYRPSDLFLKIYSNVLDTLEHGPLKNMCSPSLMGSSGVIPMSIISLVPDIMRYYKELIISAKHEVFLATNYWEPSWGSHFIHDGLIELSNRCRDLPANERPVVKLIFDRGSLKQVAKNHQRVDPSDWAGLGLPAKEELGGIHLEVMNYHRPIMGTFHAKYMVIDRRVACLSSNNIQDRVNLELNVHLEGAIVEAFYDMALLSWAEVMDPPLPSLLNPALSQERAGAGDCFDEAQRMKEQLIRNSADALPGHPDTSNTDRADANTTGQPSPSPSPSPSPQPQGDGAAAVDGEETTHNPVKREHEKKAEKKQAKERPKPMTDFTLIRAEGFEPFVVHERHDPVPIAMVNRAPHGTPGHADVDVPQNVAWETGIRLAQKSVFIQTPDFNAPEVVEAVLDACRRGIVCTLYVCLGYNDQGEMLPMQGGTNSKVFAKMCDVLSKEGESSGQDLRQNLRASWYTAKDRDRPVDASKKERNCHVKFCCIDEQVTILGNGNQDAQSWYHSQEANVMVDSPALAREWLRALNHNQNSATLGPVGRDGVWRDADGNEVASSGGMGGPLNVAKGMLNAVARVQGKGGF
ncbi:uncharacterized protein PHACADRAFT_255202 [Phanerochaete carnosa HHB-10118-sp]|uniref:PLD phosphodiesterase domain-containing protein n=1 Tax=Phanerochaete carnosa (strain HHB-10118-sp) TaxID=650164 RepID=K5W7K9_PHACS|nr:uncharacterized protein PHACADRAFT_255202 [Phanerochaete carnosa HHB-10118-sp]EKM54954.1 hypothetical protein PHACADRAFT_255202 [Phanerochaete carnosa HHB-10118-sp]